MKIALFLPHCNEIITNGAQQQAFFLIQCLEKNIHSISYLSDNDGSLFDYKINNINKISKKDLSTFDFIICFKLIQNFNLLQFLYNKNVKLIWYNCGNIYYMFQEDIIFNKFNFIQSQQLYLKYYQQIWSIPNYTQFHSFLKSITTIDTIHEAPYIWDSKYINLFQSKQSCDLSYTYFNSEIKYIIIAEPNIQITKTCLVPLLICNEYYKHISKNIQIICLSSPETSSFRQFLNNLELKNNTKILPRISFFEILLKYKKLKRDIFILSHQRDNPLNFLHLESFYLNYPLIHNTDLYEKCGYFYNSIDEGVNQLNKAIQNHKYLKKDINKKLLFSFSPLNKVNQSKYLSFLDENLLFKKSILEKTISINTNTKNIYLVVTNGFGNRMRMLSSLYIFSKIANMNLYVIWNKTIECDISSEEIFGQKNDSLFTFITESDLNQLNLQNCIEYKNINLGEKINDIENIIMYNEIVNLKIHGGYELYVPKFKNVKYSIDYFSSKRKEFYKNLQFSDTVQLLFKEKFKYLPSQFIAIHFRKLVQSIDSKYLNNSLLNFESFTSLRDISTFIESDYYGQYKTIPHVILSNDAESIHALKQNLIQKKINVINSCNLDSISNRNTIETVVDFIALSKAEFIVGSFYSSFSDEASVMGKSIKIIPSNKKLIQNNIHYHCHNFNKNNLFYYIKY